MSQKLVSLTTGLVTAVPDGSLRGKTRDIKDYKILNQIGEGTYGIVYRALDIEFGETVALKRVRMEQENSGLPISALREITLLRKLQHLNIVRVQDMASGVTLKSIYVVMEYCHHDLGKLLAHMPVAFLESEVKCLVLQLLEGVRYLHRRFIIHRDLKVSNLLLTDKGILKVETQRLQQRVE